MLSDLLRCAESIYLRNGLDDDFETLAMCNYTTFVNVARAFQKIENKSEDFKFSEEIYANLQRAAEVAIKTVDVFRKIYAECLNRKPKVSRAALQRIKGSFMTYRNILHDPILATVKNSGVRQIPCRDKVGKYRRWTTAMFERDPEDFISVEMQLRNDFAALCSSLQSTWAEMSEASKDLANNPQYVKRRSMGVSRTQGSTAVRLFASGTSTD